MMFFLAAGNAMPPEEVTVLFLALAVMLGAARLMGEIVRQLGQPPVLGELLAGIILGPTIFGQIAPGAFEWLFDPEKHQSAYLVLQGLIMVSASLLLLVAGLEVDLSVAWRQGRSAVLVALLGMAAPFTIAFTIGMLHPPSLLGEADAQLTAPPLAFAIFAGIALSITALPVIAKILMDLGMLKSDLGTLIMSAAILNDLIGWMGFAVVMALLPPEALGGTAEAADKGGANGVLMTLMMTVVFLVFMMTVCRIGINRILPYIQAHGSWPGAVIGFVLVITLLSAAATEYIGIHAIFGAFIAGVIVGDSQHVRQRTRDTIEQFITNIFAPLFFASIGLSVNFIEAFNPLVVILALGIACIGKVGGCYFASRIAGFRNSESMAIGFGMVAQGTMGVILGQLALQANLINDQLFVAIVVVAIVTSLISGPAMQRALRLKQQKGLGDLLSEKQFVPSLQARSVRAVIEELAKSASVASGLEEHEIVDKVWQREQIIHTGLGDGLAVPHARFANLKHSVVVIGRSGHGIDFDAPDGKPARIICMLLTPARDQTAQIDMLRMIAEAFNDPGRRQKALNAPSYTEFLVAIKLPGEEEDPMEAA